MNYWIEWVYSEIELSNFRLNNTQFTQEKIKSVFHDPSTGEPWLEGDIYTRPDLAETLLKLAEAGDNGEENLGFYSGE